MANFFVCANAPDEAHFWPVRLGYIDPLVKDLEKLGHTICNPSQTFDRKFEWIRDLEEIRYCDVFVFFSWALKSEVGRVHYSYASSLDKLILPIVVNANWPSWYKDEDDLSPDLLPPALLKLPALEYQPNDLDGYLRLAKVLRNLPAPKSLPNPLPPEPEDPRPGLSPL